MMKTDLRLVSGVSDKFRKVVFLSVLSPIYLAIFVGFVVGVVFATVRLNWWKLIYPSLAMLLPPLLFIYVILFGIYAFAILVRAKQIYPRLLKFESQGIESTSELLQFASLYSSFPFYSALISLIVWIVGGILSYIVIKVGEISDNQVASSFLMHIIFLSLPISQIIYYYLERRLTGIFRVEGKIGERIYFSPIVPVKLKIFTAFVSFILFTAFFIGSIFVENYLRQLRYSEAKRSFEIFVSGEAVPGAVPFELKTSDNEHQFIDKVILSGIKEKIRIGENILFDHMSSGAFVFFLSQKEDAIKGLYLPLKWIEGEFKKLFASLLGILAVMIPVVAYAFYSSLISCVSQSLNLLDSKRIVMTNDEFFGISAEGCYMQENIESLNSKYEDLSSKVGGILSKVFSDSISLRGQINYLINELKLVRVNAERIIALSGKEIEILKTSPIEVSPDSSGEISDALKELRDLRSKFSAISSKFQKFYDILKADTKKTFIIPQNEAGMRIEIHVEKKFQIIRNSFEMLIKSLDELDESIKGSRGAVEDLEEKFKNVEGLYSEIDRLKKRLVILSMNISISSAKIAQTEISREFSTFSKQLSSLISEDIRRVESDMKEVLSLISEIRKKLEVLIGDSAIADKIESVKAYAGKVDDILEDFTAYVSQLTTHIGDTRRTIFEVSKSISDFESKFSELANLSEGMKGSISEIIPNLDSVSARLERASQSIKDLESKYERLSAEYQLVITRYNEIVRELKISLDGVREEGRKIISSVDKLEAELANIRDLVDRTISYTESAIKNPDSEV